MKLRIIGVDEHGFNGRDHAPEESDIGQVVTVLAMELLHYAPDTGVETRLADLLADNLAALVRDTENCLPCWVVMTDDGRVLEVMGHEVENMAVQAADAALLDAMAHDYQPDVNRVRERLRAALARL